MSETTASGTFEVKMSLASAADAAVGRFTLDKTYHGDLEAASTGEMLAVQGGVAGSAGYVAIERVTGTLAGRAGSFALQHNGLMDRGAPTLAVAIVPDSGTDALAGIAGEMTIDASGGGHSYTLRYRLPD